MKIEQVRRKVQDAWLSLKTGMGTSQDRTQSTVYVAGYQKSEYQLTSLYRYNWLARRIVDALPHRAMARGVSEETPWPTPYGVINHAKWAEGAFLRAACLGRLYGGAGLYLGYVSGADLTKPGTGQIAFVDIFTRYDLECAKATPEQKNTPADMPERWPGEWRDEDPASPTFGDPVVWTVIGTHNRRGLQFHASRMQKFGGVSRPPEGLGTTIDPKDKDWSDSVLLALWDDVRRYGTMWANIDQLIDVASIGVLRQKGLFDFVGGENESAARARIDVFNAGIANGRVMLLDADGNEDYHREGVSFAGIPELLQELQLATAGAVNMPVTELFGRSPAGMNATGESDTKKWDAACGEYREHQIQANADAYATALAGKTTAIAFMPISAPSEKESAEIRNLEIAGTDKLISLSVFSPAEVRKAMMAGSYVEDLKGLPAEPPEEPEPQPLDQPFDGGADGSTSEA